MARNLAGREAESRNEEPRKRVWGVLSVRLATVGLVAALAPVAAAAQDTTWNRYTLDGLVGVHIRAETNLGCEGAGVSAESIRADATAVLEAAEVPLLTEQEMLADPGLPELRVTFECGGGVAGAVGYSVSVRVQQATQMIRDTQITLSEAVTWWASGVGVAAAGSTAETLKGVLEAKLGEFAEAFKEANGEEG
ncbi:MAG: hypothetical protein F4X60_04970 [Gemmatimonadetes bacterium]|nr:hypothetical protein [Gemmatimonadota bacterium]